jgi:CMP-N-acetylneuraminic acid synthetase
MVTQAFIFARGGSKGLPGKNIKNFCGKPLIAWSIEQALAVESINGVIVSTDSQEIAEVSRKFGAEVPFMRPNHLAQDESPEILSWKHALNFLIERDGVLPSAMLSLPATAPLRDASDIKNCLDLFNQGDSDVVITVSASYRNPFFNMVQLTDKDFAKVVIRDTSTISRRQDAKEVFDIATVAYVARPEFILNSQSIFDGVVRAVRVPRERSVDIDSLFDFEVAEALLSKKLQQNVKNQT